ncbi:MAG: CYTH domain-containing protein [Methylococcaceae bacterium]|jgi:adenylate cyclase
MAIEIERKFLLANDSWRPLASKSSAYKQGYLSAEKTSSIRVRTSDNQAWLNIKSATIGTQRQEFEYEIPLDDAHEILDTLCKPPLIEKIRHFVMANGNTWEIDEFFGENTGLIVAEIELDSADQEFDMPTWLGQEVTYDLRYYNNNLAKLPFSKWEKS